MIAWLIASMVTVSAAPASPLLDGRCEAEVWSKIPAKPVGEGVSLRLMQDDRFFYLCAQLPPGSFGSTDLYIQGADGRRFNMHASAQVGEREWGASGWPDWRFGNQVGWHSPAGAFSGLRRLEDGSIQPRFSASEAREMQIGKEKIGRGPWRLRLEIRALGETQSQVMIFPETSTDDNPNSWALLEGLKPG